VLHGQLTTSSGDVVPLTVTLVKEDETWRIHSVDADYGGFATDQGQEIPAEDELKKMVTASMVDLGRAINAGDFTDFHGNIAELWQRQITNEELLNAFQAFVDAELDLTTVQGLEPILSAEPYFDDQGALTVDGHYPTEWGETHFHLRYFYEDPKWKLVGVNVRVE
jgi:hypothetical protein